MKSPHPSLALVASVFSVGLLGSAPAFADEPATPAPDPAAQPAPAPPTQEQLAAAKKAFEEGNALYKAGKLAEAVDKLKESFRLSRNAFLLYNIGHTYDQLGQKDMVLFYYRKFLAAAPANAPMRDNVAKRVAELEAEDIQAATSEPDDQVQAVATPTSKYSAKDFKHEIVFTVPPGNPVDVTASVPQDSGFTVKLFYRAAGEASFISKPMTWRNMELVARIPAPKVSGSSVQYYIEVRDAQDKLVTRSGKSTSPNLVNIERGAPAHYIPDFVDEGGEVFVPNPVDEMVIDTGTPGVEGKPGSGLAIAKWAATGTAGAALITSVVSYVMAGKQHDKLVADTYECGLPPCREFDAEFGQKVEELGVRYDTIYKVSLGIGVAAAALGGYLWYRDITRKKRSDVMVAPVAGEGLTGATAVVRF